MGNLCVKKKDSTIHNATPPNNINPGIPDPSDNDKEEPKVKISPPPVSPTVVRSTTKIVVALYTYDARDQGDLSFHEGDRLGILDDSDPDWWRACHLVHMTEGIIPCIYVAPEKSVESEDWFFGQVSRKDAEKMLMTASNPRGAFLIRNCGQTAGVTKVCYKFKSKHECSS